MTIKRFLGLDIQEEKYRFAVDPVIRGRLQEEFLRLQNWKVAWDAERGVLDVADASTTKVFGTEHYLDAIRLMMEVIGQPAYVKKGSPGAVLAARLEAMYRSLVILTFGGGVNEVQRDLISVFGLGMPMAPR